MELPVFRYSPNAYSLTVFVPEEGTCSSCQQRRQLKYTASFYSIDNPAYICPWCIADGSAAKKYSGEFNDFTGIEGISANPDETPLVAIPLEKALDVATKNPAYVSWQQGVWLSHCGEPCAFIDYADYSTIKPYIDELKADLDEMGYDLSFIENNLSKNGSLAGYLFQCLHCETHRLHVDCD